MENPPAGNGLTKTLPLWPFLIVDLVFLALAGFIFQQSHRPLVWWEVGALILCAALGAAAFILPVLQRNTDRQTLLQAEKLADTAGKIQALEQLAAQIAQATSQWQAIQDTAAKTAQTSATLAQNMSSEAKAFTEFLQKANDLERSHLRLEIEKLRRAEADWLQIVVRLLDQVHALFQAAQQSGQPGLIAQIGHFQNACREIPRRVGLNAVPALPGEAFDPMRHQLQNDAPGPDAPVSILDCVAPGYTYQGQLLRRPLVRLQPTAA
jgi:molecular chaperone GrpE (heat shock protein)